MRAKTITKNKTQLRGESLLRALETGRMTQYDFETIVLGAQMWLAFGGTSSMNRYLGLPATSGQLKLARRNYWLRKAADLLPNFVIEDSEFLKARALHSELEIFVSRGIWSKWKDYRNPPKDASELRTALFYIAKIDNGEVLGERQIYTVLKQ